jgi:hypothetical protein
MRGLAKEKQYACLDSNIGLTDAGMMNFLQQR